VYWMDFVEGEGAGHGGESVRLALPSPVSSSSTLSASPSSFAPPSTLDGGNILLLTHFPHEALVTMDSCLEKELKAQGWQEEALAGSSSPKATSAMDGSAKPTAEG
jgi:hypothetical protein